VSPKLRPMSAKEVIKFIEANGFVFDRQGKGAHSVYKNHDTKRTTIISDHGHVEIPVGTLKAIEKQTGLQLPKL
jgi:predicted RNA binding protein YcfA (HicA-like mRNA interferase family)